jgi:hypothetical protein
LLQQLQAESSGCSVMVMHHPRWSSGDTHGSKLFVDALWDTFVNNGGDISISGHDHFYERFAEMNASNTQPNADTNGVRHFVVGTGGISFYTVVANGIANSESRITQTHGILKLDVTGLTYSWQFIRATDGAVLDSGSGTCD